MKQGKSIEALVTEIERQSMIKRDYIAPVATMRMGDDGNSMSIAGQNEGRPLGMLGLAHDQIGTYTDIPAKFYDRLRNEQPALLANNVNTLMASHKADKRFVRTLDGNVRAFLSERYRSLDNVDLMRNVLPYLMERSDITFASAEITQRRLYLKVISTELVGEVKRGDEVRAGLIIQNSEVGSGSLVIAPFTERLVCTNGMTHLTYGQRKAHLGRALGNDDENAEQFFADDTRKADDTAFFLKARDTIKAVLSGDVLQKLLADMRKAGEEEITGDPVEVVSAVAVQVGLTDKERGGVLSNLIKGADLSRWGMVNAITRTAQDAADYDRASELEKIGGDLLSAGGRLSELKPTPVKVKRGRQQPQPTPEYAGA